MRRPELGPTVEDERGEKQEKRRKMTIGRWKEKWRGGGGGGGGGGEHGRIN